MRRAFLFILLCGCLTAQDSAGIQGLAIGAITRQPMLGVHITMRSGSPDALPSAAYGAISGPDGHFSIANMPPALYFLTAQHNGYVYSPSDASVTLKPGNALTDFTVKMTPRALIAGHVVDEFGDPVQHVEVTAVPASGSRAGESGMNGRTDERGQFGMTGSPGKFYVRTSATREMTFGIPEISADGLGPAACGATYYPGSETKDRASAVEVAAGHDLDRHPSGTKTQPDHQRNGDGNVRKLPARQGIAVVRRGRHAGIRNRSRRQIHSRRSNARPPPDTGPTAIRRLAPAEPGCRCATRQRRQEWGHSDIDNRRSADRYCGNCGRPRDHCADRKVYGSARKFVNT